ncbi:MAG TPA: hypothetical protein VFB85_14410 [Vicinamibacterales bacterium]|nr:hypothetical protein [Vicinamibacterales bacterium]
MQAALAAARERTQRRRQSVADAERSYERFLADVAVPIVRQVANVLKAEGRAFTVSTPAGAVRLSPDRGRDEFVEITLTTEADPPAVVGRIRYTRGSRTVDEERSVKPDAPPDQISDEDLLEFLIRALDPWFER